ncbi:unnamed protein product [Gordionus sp. m RMFG-2023]
MDWKFLDQNIEDAFEYEQINSNKSIESLENKCMIKKAIPDIKITNLQTHNETSLKKNEFEHTYNIMWADRSSRKHKIWKGDGILYVKHNLMELRDTEDNLIMKTSDSKKCKIDLNEGSILILGSKEVLIVSEI